MNPVLFVKNLLPTRSEPNLTFLVICPIPCVIRRRRLTAQEIDAGTRSTTKTVTIVESTFLWKTQWFSYVNTLRFTIEKLGKAQFLEIHDLCGHTDLIIIQISSGGQIDGWFSIFHVFTVRKNINEVPNRSRCSFARISDFLLRIFSHEWYGPQRSARSARPCCEMYTHGNYYN